VNVHREAGEQGQIERAHDGKNGGGEMIFVCALDVHEREGNEGGMEGEVRNVAMLG